MGKVLGRLHAFDTLLVQPLVQDGAVAALDVGVLLRLARLVVSTKPILT